MKLSEIGATAIRYEPHRLFAKYWFALSAAPAVFVLAGVVVHQCWSLARRRLHIRWQLGLPLPVLAATFTLALNLNTYFIEYDRITDGLVPLNIDRAMAAEPPGPAVFLAGAPHLYANHGTIQFIAGPARPRDLEDLDQLAAVYQVGDGLLVVAVHERDAELDAVRKQFPGASLPPTWISRDACSLLPTGSPHKRR